MLNCRIKKVIETSTKAQSFSAGESIPTSFRCHRHLVLLGCLVFFAVVLGCDDGSADRIRMRKACLQEIFSGYAAFVQEHQLGPADIEAFRDFMDQKAPKTEKEPVSMIAGQVVSDEAIARMKDGDIVVIWAAILPAEEDTRAEYVVAFEAGVPGSGGYIVSADGEVQHVTAAKFSQFHELKP